MKNKNYFGKAPIILGVIGLACSCSTTDFSRGFNNFMQPEKNLLEFVHEEINKPILSADLALTYDLKAAGGYYDYVSEPIEGVPEMPLDTKYKFIAPFNKNDSIYVKYCGEIDRAYLSAYQINERTTKKDNSRYEIAYSEFNNINSLYRIINDGVYRYSKNPSEELWSKHDKNYSYNTTRTDALTFNIIDAFTSIPQDFEVYFRVIAMLGMDFRFPFYPTHDVFHISDYSQVAFQLCSRYIDLLQNYTNPYDFTDYLCTQLFFLEPDEYEAVRGEISKRIFELKNESNISLFKLNYDIKGDEINVSLTLSNETYQRLFTNLTRAVEDAYKEVAKVVHSIDSHDYIYLEAINGMPKNFSCQRKVKIVDLKYVDYDLYFNYSDAKLLCYYDSYTDEQGNDYYDTPIICNEMNQHIHVTSIMGGNNREKVVVPTKDQCFANDNSL